MGTNYTNPSFVANNGMVLASQPSNSGYSYGYGNGNSTSYNYYQSYRWVQGVWQPLTASNAVLYGPAQMNNNGTVVGSVTLATGTSDVNFNPSQGAIWGADPAHPQAQASDIPLVCPSINNFNGASRSYLFSTDGTTDYSYGNLYASQAFQAFWLFPQAEYGTGDILHRPPSASDSDSADFHFPQAAYSVSSSGQSTPLGTPNYSGFFFSENDGVDPLPTGMDIWGHSFTYPDPTPAAPYAPYYYQNIDTQAVEADMCFTGLCENPIAGNKNGVIAGETVWNLSLNTATDVAPGYPVGKLKYFAPPSLPLSNGTALPSTMDRVVGITHATSGADDVIIGSNSTNYLSNYYWAPGSGSSSATPLKGFAKGINTRYYVPGGSTGNVPDFQMVGASTNGAPLMWERTRTAAGAPATPTAYNALPVQTLVSGNAWQFGYVTSINDSGAIVGTATQVQDSSGNPIPPASQVSHGVMLLPVQFSLLNGNQSGPDGLNFDGTRPTKISSTGPDNPATVISSDLAALSVPPEIPIDVLGTVSPMGEGRAEYPHWCYTSSLVVAAKVPPLSQINATYSWNRTVNIHEVWLHWTGLLWSVTQKSYLAGHPDLSDHEYDTAVPSPNNELYVFDNPAEALFPNYSNASIGDYAYVEYDFTYTLTITVGSSPPSQFTMHVGNTLLAKRVNHTSNVIADWQGLENIVSSSNIPDCQITSSKIQKIVGYLPFPSVQISIPSNINTPTGN